jgi:hypothetical protein
MSRIVMTVEIQFRMVLISLLCQQRLLSRVASRGRFLDKVLCRC